VPPRSPAQGFREGASDNRKADQHCCSDPQLHIAAPLDLANDAALAVSRREDSQVVDSQTPNRLDAGALLASLSGRCQAFCRVLPAGGLRPKAASECGGGTIYALAVQRLRIHEALYAARAFSRRLVAVLDARARRLRLCHKGTSQTKRQIETRADTWGRVMTLVVNFGRFV